MSTFGEILACFKKKSAEEPENIVPLIDDAVLTNGLIAWKSIVIKYKPVEQCPCSDEASQWEWLWNQIEFDTTKFGSVAGVKSQEVGALLTRLKGLRLIYPDGTIDNLAKQYLQSLIAAKIKKATRGLPKETKEKPLSGSNPKSG
jgi:hypothetical protein